MQGPVVWPPRDATTLNVKKMTFISMFILIFFRILLPNGWQRPLNFFIPPKELNHGRSKENSNESHS